MYVWNDTLVLVTANNVVMKYSNLLRVKGKVKLSILCKLTSLITGMRVFMESFSVLNIERLSNNSWRRRLCYR